MQGRDVLCCSVDADVSLVKVNLYVEPRVAATEREQTFLSAYAFVVKG